MYNKLIEAVLTKASGMIMDKVSDVVSTMTTTHITYYEYDQNWELIQEVLYRMNKKKFNQNRMVSTQVDRPLLAIPCNYKFRYRDCIINVCGKVEFRGHNDEKNIVISIFGNRRDEVRNKIMHTMLRYIRKDRAVVIFNTTNGYQRSIDIGDRGINDLVLKDDLKERLISHLWWWDKNKDWFRRHGIPHKTGILLYGEPGTGKSSLVKAISNMLGKCPIFSMNIFNVSDTFGELLLIRKQYSGTIIGLIEDFDFGCKSMRSDSNLSNENSVDNITYAKNQQLLFQLLDGLFSIEDIVWIATTNHIEVLDPALIRPGRFDIRMSLPYFERDDAIALATIFEFTDPAKVIDSLNLTYPVQPAKLQNLLVQKRMRVNILDKQ